MTSELRPAAWMYRRMTTAEGDRVEFTRTPWAYVLTGYTETPLYTLEAVRAERAAELAKWKALAETLAGALEQIEKAPAWGYPDKWETTPAQVRILARQALTSYKEQRDVAG